MTAEERIKKNLPAEGISPDGTDDAFWADFLSEEELEEIARIREAQDKQQE